MLWAKLLPHLAHKAVRKMAQEINRVAYNKFEAKRHNLNIAQMSK